MQQFKMWMAQQKLMQVVARLLLVVGLLMPLAQPLPVQAQDEEIGYLWSLYFDFEHNFDGVLTIEVGPWKNGNLVEVHETSKSVVRCSRVGPVQLNGGDAVFNGASYLTCQMDLAAVVEANHGLIIDPVDDYGSIVAYTKAQATSATVLPIFTHPDARYSLDMTIPSQPTVVQTLWNGVGPMQATFAAPGYNSWQSYTHLYSCISNGGPCTATFGVGAQVQNVPTAGSRAQFSTGPTTFEIGYDSGLFFVGRMASLLIDPGNSAH